MVTAGIKELKAKLSSYIDKINSGEQIVVTEHGEEVAVIIPFSKERAAIRALVKTGKAQWSGGKPAGIKGMKLKGRPLSRTILEGRQ